MRFLLAATSELPSLLRNEELHSPATEDCLATITSPPAARTVNDLQLLHQASCDGFVYCVIRRVASEFVYVFRFANARVVVAACARSTSVTFHAAVAFGAA